MPWTWIRGRPWWWRPTAELTDLTGVVRAAVTADPRVDAVEPVGSRAGGTPNALSDWDFVIVTDDEPAVAAALPALVEPLAPLSRQWDRLGPPTYSCYMLMLTGPAKVDLILPGLPHEPAPPWTVSGATLPAIDAHFWDWILWLASKDFAGRDELVSEQLAVLQDHLLGPVGVTATPDSVPDAVDRYVAARDRRSAELGVHLDERLERAVRPALPT